jgi:hypothetical protein
MIEWLDTDDQIPILEALAEAGKGSAMAQEKKLPIATQQWLIDHNCETDAVEEGK